MCYPLLDDELPSFPTQSIAYKEFDDIEWEVEYEVVKPNDPSPAPSDAFNGSKAPISIYRNQCGNLHEHMAVDRGHHSNCESSL